MKSPFLNYDSQRFVCGTVLCVDRVEDGGSVFPRNIGIYLRIHTALLNRRPTTSTVTDCYKLQRLSRYQPTKSRVMAVIGTRSVLYFRISHSTTGKAGKSMSLRSACTYTPSTAKLT